LRLDFDEGVSLGVTGHTAPPYRPIGLDVADVKGGLAVAPGPATS